VSGKALTHHNDSAARDARSAAARGVRVCRRARRFSVRLVSEAAGFDATKKYRSSISFTAVRRGRGRQLGPRWNNQMFAARGAASSLRGELSRIEPAYGQKFTDAISQHWGDYPYEDVMKGVDVVARLPYVDSTRMGAAGASYGGYMVYWLAGHTNRFKVLVDHDGVFNTASMAGSTEELWFTDWEFGGTVYANRALYEKWSPLNFVSNWRRRC